MALILQLRPDLEENLVEQARAQGLSLEAYIESLLERQLVPETGEQRLSLEEFEAQLDALGEFSDKIPELPLEALTREGIYTDHD